MLYLDAGKYAPYVWPAYAITVAVFVWLIADSLVSASRWRRAVKAREEEAAGEARADGAKTGAPAKDAAE
jgi:heme exporter protein D